VPGSWFLPEYAWLIFAKEYATIAILETNIYARLSNSTSVAIVRFIVVRGLVFNSKRLWSLNQRSVLKAGLGVALTVFAAVWLIAVSVSAQALDLSSSSADFSSSGFSSSDVSSADFLKTGIAETRSSVLSLDDGIQLPQILLGGPEFLPVEEAYRVRPSLLGEEVYLDWSIAPGYYLYKDKFSVREAGDVEQGSVGIWQQSLETGRPIYDEYYEKNLEVFYEHTRVTLTRAPQDSLAANLSTVLVIGSQGCADAGLCYPPRTQYLVVNHELGTVDEITESELPAQLNSGSGAGVISTAESVEESTAQTGIWMLLGFALLGGLILNLMPCVFPVLSIKALSVTTAHIEGHGRHSHGFAYAAGVILSFVAIALLLLALRSAGHVIGWGFQLQSPVFITLLVYLFFLMGQAFSGQFTLGARWMNVGQAATAGSGLGSSFMTGVLATVVASPCTAPFMGTALGIAITQPGVTAILVFAVLGFGMALPFLLLTWVPGLAGSLPKPGPWMETFQQALAFPLYASVLWLLWVLGRQTDIDHAIIAALGLLLLVFAMWLYGRSRKWGGKAVAGVLMIIGLVLPLSAINGAGRSVTNGNLPGGAMDTAENSTWEPFTQARLDQLRADRQSVFINLTADWCITCLANEKMALSSERFKAALKDNNIYYLKGDWTNHNPEVTRLLGEHGRGGVPLYLYYPAGGEARILPQLLTQNIVLKAFGLVD